MMSKKERNKNQVQFLQYISLYTKIKPLSDEKMEKISLNFRSFLSKNVQEISSFFFIFGLKTP